MEKHEDREKIEAKVMADPDVCLDQGQKMIVQVLLDIRDELYRLNRNSGVQKWGSKI